MRLPDDAHRPWPVPRAPWVMFMRWRDLLFLHWPLPPQTLRPLIPEPLELETFDGHAWLGITPFLMRCTRPRLLPPIPIISSFPELNVRTYVRHHDKPGVWFFSLDAARWLAVWGARVTHSLPYHVADMRVTHDPHAIHFVSQRARAAPGVARLDITYQPAGAVANAAAGSLDHFLTERYCLYAQDRSRRIWRAEIHHAPWPLQPAEAEIRTNTMTAPIDVTLPDRQPLLHFARQLDVVTWCPRRI
jgi:uncharacterized protein